MVNPNPMSEDEPLQQREQKQVTPSCSSVKTLPAPEDDDDLLSEEDELASYEEEEYNAKLKSPTKLGLHCYNLQKGTNLELTRIHKYITNQGYYPFAYYITLDAVDSDNNTPCTFQTCLVEYPLMNGDTVGSSEVGHISACLEKI
ncbi:hypothetical protein Bca52824_001395 [Brassica carinata]|uniref:Uncharacterized protein n=1 Tax=Brassica carinata TaxID=52824 RepID=A0A8X7WJB5_BRACI|nr:hypothetical protein Bca52824_001395 [Brassica carinata]